jgi:hypothetical protein
MRSSQAAYAVPVFLLLLSSEAFGQMPAVPDNPNELVTQNAKPVTSPKQRSAALELLGRAREASNLSSVGEPFTMKVSFTSNRQTESNGTMEETWLGSAWRWTAEIGGASYERVGTGDQVFAASAGEPIPMRLQMVRSAIFSPIAPRLGQAVIRSATVHYRGHEVACFLLSGGVGIVGPRFWVETEYCVDPNTGLLQMWSEAPGIYVTYNYDGALEFHGHAVVREITVTEGYDAVLQIRVDSIRDASSVNAQTLAAGQEMSPSFLLSGPFRFPMRVDPEGGTSSSVIRPVIVHATLDSQDGVVMDAEVVESSDTRLNEQALDVVWNSGFAATGMQREVFINVQFHMPAESGVTASVEPIVWVPIGVIRVTRRPRRVAGRPGIPGSTLPHIAEPGRTSPLP